ncbi:MAG: squalene--hopene cyclase [Planctomycetota bacterium]|jgi:hypothetical protein|nr:MAG: squalene--hopene cyclase [Planctomycetota bacterium]
MHTAWIAWGVLAAALAVALAALVRTRWLQSHTLTKCVLLSVLLHAVLAAVCAFVGGWAPASWGTGGGERMTMLVVASDEPSDDLSLGDAAAPVPDEELPHEPDATPQEPTAPAATLAADAEAPAAPQDLVPLLDAPAEAATEPPASTTATATADSTAAADATRSSTPARAVPDTYADRVGDRRAAAAAARGGSRATEEAVQAALAWLAAAQSADGRWNAARHGGGVERAVQGQHRNGAGARSDHGVTGLALLAFLGAGNTHLEGPYAETVSRGLRFLVDRQRGDGSLQGDAEFFAALYCHGMATIALGECVAMTGDAAWKPALERAVRHTLAMQHPHTGGWRYAAGDRGDTSQLGWQVMVLLTARNAGLQGFEGAENGARRYLQGVSSGAAGGLAAYRPGERASVAMTAEALTCRLFLGLPADHPTVTEALDLIDRSPPVSSAPNAYTWYYATLASFHAGGPQWDRWNARLQAALLPLQHRGGGALDGSWDPDPVWGGHGGRVYATALSAMTLEVYYRHLPMHRRAERVAAAP